MAHSYLAAIKVTSTIGLGLLSSFHLTMSLSTFPAIHALASASSASTLVAAPRRQLLLASCGSLFCGVLAAGAYAASGEQGRHPYLLYALFGALATPAYSYVAVDTLLGGITGQSALEALLDTFSSAARAQRSGVQGGRAQGGPLAGGDLEKQQQQVNGEELSLNVERLIRRNYTAAALAGLAFVVSAIGNYGDRY